MSRGQHRRTGGDVVIESLTALGADTVFGVPGQHALGTFSALSRSDLRYVGLRTELSAGFAADGYARTRRSVAPLLVSTGPGALISVAALQEAAAAAVPVLAISSQIPRAGLGGLRKGYLHELRDQRASVRDVVKLAETVTQPGQIPSALAGAWETAMSPPDGPVWVEIPQDVLLGDADDVPPVRDLTTAPRVPAPREEVIAEAARLLSAARRPVILAGGGVVRANAERVLLELAEALRAPVAVTFGAKGAFPWEHPLSLQSWLEDWHTTQFLADADVLLVVGSGLGELSSNYHAFRPSGRVIQIEADVGKLEANHPALAIHADAALALQALVGIVTARPPDGVAERQTTEVLDRVRERLAQQGLVVELGVLDAVRAALPDDCPSFWDMTILGYWAWSAWDARVSGSMSSAQGAGGLGYAFPAALGAAAAGRHDRVLAVSGDGGAMYGIAELATARQHDLPVTWLIVDDGGYGILREYMSDAFGAAFGTELVRPDFVALSESFRVPARQSSPETLEKDLSAAMAEDGPNVVVLPALLRMFAPTHLHALGDDDR